MASKEWKPGWWNYDYAEFVAAIAMDLGGTNLGKLALEFEPTLLRQAAIDAAVVLEGRWRRGEFGGIGDFDLEETAYRTGRNIIRFTRRNGIPPKEDQLEELVEIVPLGLS